MNRESAEKLAFIIGHADGGCQNCVEDLCRIASEQFPEWGFDHEGEQHRRRIAVVVRPRSEHDKIIQEREDVSLARQEKARAEAKEKEIAFNNRMAGPV